MTSEQAAAPDPHDRLGAAVRALSDVVVRSGAGLDDLAAAAAAIEGVTGQLARARPSSRVHDSPYHPMSLVGGTAHPVAPQLHTTPTEDGVAGTVALGPAYEGGPGLAHGGVLSLLFDHAMGQALFTAGYSAMTVSLEVRYRAPTPLETPLAVSARLDRVDGRKLFVAGQIAVGGRVTAEAQGVFVQLTEANVAQIFPPNRVPDGPPPAPLNS
ncbi:MAG: PaaI family thioesterase [Jatrophihabitans sp.]|uniref:PaaI family thioesterase n=1 Tax=Jatrophihabitans sp. TaxID=1932789 RepID=UPI0039133CD7